MTPPDPQQVAEIAGRLSKAQREHLTVKGTDLGCVASNAQLVDHLISKGLAFRTTWRSRRMLDWTDLGLAVRNFIQGTHHD